MRFRLKTALLLLAVTALARPAAAQSDEAERIRESVVVFQEIMGAPDNAIPNSVLDKAEGIAIFPGTLRGGFIVGAQRGRGILSVRDRAKNTWSAPAFLTLTGGSIGAQIGGQATDIVLIIMNARGMQNLMANQFKIGADASAAAGPVGREATAATDVQMRAEILSYSRARGLFAGVTVNGAAVRADRDANERFYGTGFNTRQVVEGKGGAPEPVASLRQILSKYTS